MEQTNLFTACQESLGSIQEQVNIELNLENGSIGKVLCVNTNAKIDELITMQNEIIMNGSIFTNLIYLNEVGELKNLTTTTPFNFRKDFELAAANSEILKKVEIIESDINYVTENEVKLVVSLEISLEQIKEQQIESFTPQNESIKTKKDKILLTHVKSSNKAKFNVLAEQAIKFDTNQIIITNISPCVKSVTSGTGYFTIDGEVSVSYIAQSLNEDRPIKCFCETLTFKEEIEDEKLLKTDLILSSVSALNEDVLIELSNNDGKAQFGLTIPLSVDYIALFEEESDVVSDAYSLNCDTTLETNTVNFCKINTPKYTETRIDSSITILEQEPRIARISCVSPNSISLTKTYLNKNNLVVEGFAKACVVYEADDENIVLTSVQAEIPFSVELKNIAAENENVFVKANICSAQAKAKKGKEIDIDLDLCFVINTFSKTETKIVNNIVIGECSTKSDYALKVHIAPEGTTLWDLCKKLKSSEEDILEQNPDVTFPLNKPTSIIYFNRRTENK